MLFILLRKWVNTNLAGPVFCSNGVQVTQAGKIALKTMMVSSTIVQLGDQFLFRFLT